MTVYVQDYDKEGRFLDTFTRMKFHGEGFQEFLRNTGAFGLQAIGEIDECPTTLCDIRDLQPKKRYTIHAPHLKAIRDGITWSQVEDQAMEEEKILSIQKALAEVNKKPVEIIGERVMKDEEGKPLMELDGVAVYGDTVFLCEAKRNVTAVCLFHSHL
jgi:hypothetical protein